MDVNECAAADRGGCDLHRSCVNETPGFHCGPCESGWGADGEKGCKQCTCSQAGGDKSCTSSSENVPSANELAGSQMIAATTLFGFQITLPDNARVTKLGALKKSDAQVNIALGLFADNGGNPGAPGMRVAVTGKVPFAGKMVSVDSRSEGTVCLRGGKYWLVAVADGDISIGSGGGAASVAVPNVSDLPTTWPGGGGSGSGQVNLFATVDHP